MAGVFEHYRVSTLGQGLKDCLEELVESEGLDENQFDLIFQHFDKAICDALSNDVRIKAVIRGALNHYRNHDDIWTVGNLSCNRYQSLLVSPLASWRMSFTSDCF